MRDTIRPENHDEVVEALRATLESGQALDVVGAGSKRAIGAPGGAETRLDLSAIAGITLYEPAELVLSARAATPMAEIEAALAEKRQQLAFEPPDWSKLLGVDGGGNVSGTLGGVVACNLGGPRRIKAGAARDHFLGFNAVSGRAETFKSGGRVVKNVTGFDLSKLMAGSYGTLAVMTAVTVKVLPAPEKTRTVLLFGAADATAFKAMRDALSSVHEVAAAAHLPAAVAKGSSVAYVAGAGRSVTAVRIEGPGASAEHRCKAVRELLSPYGETEELHSMNTATLWREIRDVLFFARDATQVWRLSVPPASGAAAAAEILSRAKGRSYYDWGGGLVWLALDPLPDAGAGIVRGAVAKSGGHATLIRAADAVRATVPVFQPQSDAVAGLGRRIKENFDPKNILNPGRMGA